MRNLVIFCLFLVSQVIFGKEEGNLFSSHRFIIDYGQINTNIYHHETSKDSGFSAINGDSNLVLHTIGPGYEYEFFNTSRVSLTAHFSGGFQTGEAVNYNAGDAKQVDFEEKATGYYGAAGASLNVNFWKKNKNIQIFVGYRSLKTQTKYLNRYINESTDSRSTELEYNISQGITETTLGMRFFHYGKKKLFSSISISKYDFKTDKVDVKASKGSSSKFDITDQAEFKQQDYGLRLGVGFIY